MSKLGEYSPRKNNRLQDYKKREERLEKRKIKIDNIDLEQVYMLARNMLPTKEIAIQLRLSEDRLRIYMERRPEILETIERGYSDTRQSLRKTQLDMAFNGNPGMLMWLGKQYLGQADKHEQSTKTEISVTVSRAMDELRNIPKDQLLAAQALLSMPVLGNDDENSGES